MGMLILKNPYFIALKLMDTPWWSCTVFDVHWTETDVFLTQKGGIEYNSRFLCVKKT